MRWFHQHVDALGRPRSPVIPLKLSSQMRLTRWAHEHMDAFRVELASDGLPQRIHMGAASQPDTPQIPRQIDGTPRIVSQLISQVAVAQGGLKEYFPNQSPKLHLERCAIPKSAVNLPQKPSRQGTEASSRGPGRNCSIPWSYV
jgi:hypothetical protein